MTRLKLFGIMMVAAFAILTSVAAAEEKTKMLPESGVTSTGKQVGGVKLIQKGGTEVECKSGKGSSTIEAANLGKYTTTFEECTSSGGKCTGEGEATGVILTSGAYGFWLALETLNGFEHTLVGALVQLPSQTKFSCVILGISVSVVVLAGCTAALATPLNTLTSTTSDTFAQIANGEELITKVLPPNSTSEILCTMLSNKAGGTFELSSLVGKAENSNFKKGAESVTTLLMNPEAHE
jgi:hypothetical protein